MNSPYRLIVINRAQDTLRLSRILSVCESLKVKPLIFEAVTSDEVTVFSSGSTNIRLVRFKDELYLHDITKSEYPITYGMMAACISYRLIYEMLLRDETHSTYIIIEDDVLASEYALQTEGAIDKYIESLPKYDIAFLDSPRYVSAETIKCSTDNYIYCSKLSFGRNYTHAISKEGAAKFISQFGKWIYKSPEDHLSKACQNIFSHIMLPQNPIFCYTDDFPSTKTPSPTKVEWYSGEYVENKDSISDFTRQPSNILDRFIFYVAQNCSLEFEAFWINVDSQLERANFMNKEWTESKIPHTRVSACTPFDLPTINVQYNCYVSNLEYACMCSHVRVYQLALQSKADWFLVLEDDMLTYEAEKHKNINVYESLKNILKDAPKDADCIQLFCSNPEAQRNLVYASLRGERYIPLEKYNWGACAYFMSRGAAEMLVKRYVSIVNNKLFIDFTSLTHPINPEAVVYTGLKCYSHTESIFTTREDIMSLVHQDHVPDHFYCNYVVRERLKYKMDSLKRKRFVFIVSPDSYASGAFELAILLNKDPYQHIETESHEMLPWIKSVPHLYTKIEMLSQRCYPIVGDVGHYYINYVQDILELENAKIIYLSVDHFTDTKNYWGRSNDLISSEYDGTYPVYDRSLAKQDAIKTYCSEVKSIADDLAKKYPHNFKVFDYSSKVRDMALPQIYDFLQTPKKSTR